MLKIALNGCGRIGKAFLRSLLADEQVFKATELVAINVGNTEPAALEYFLKYDSVHGPLKVTCEYKDGVLLLAGKKIAIVQELDARKLPWQKMGIDLVIDVTGHYTERDKAQHHLDAGAGAVLISAPAKNEDVTIICGVNEKKFNKQAHRIIALGSCTTNAVTPLLHVLDQVAGIEHAALVTTHAYTATQALVDSNPTGTDWRRSRAAGLNIVPSTTGAMEVVTRVLPHLENKLLGYALRVPVADVSLADIAVVLRKALSRDEIIAAYTTYSQQEGKNILALCNEPLVSSDFIGNPYSVVFDSTLLAVQDNFIKVAGWYDNEYGYACRLKDFIQIYVR